MSAAEEMLFQPIPLEISEWAEQARREIAEMEGAARDAAIDRLLERMRENREQAKENAEVAERRTAIINNWLLAENSQLDSQYQYLESLVLAHATGYDYGSKKSRTLPNGRFGRRITQRAGLKIVDPAAALAFAKERDIPTKVTETVQLTPLKEWAESTGETPAGCEAVPEVESYFVEVGGGKAH